MAEAWHAWAISAEYGYIDVFIERRSHVLRLTIEVMIVINVP